MIKLIIQVNLSGQYCYHYDDDDDDDNDNLMGEPLIVNT